MWDIRVVPYSNIFEDAKFHRLKIFPLQKVFCKADVQVYIHTAIKSEIGRIDAHITKLSVNYCNHDHQIVLDSFPVAS